MTMLMRKAFFMMVILLIQFLVDISMMSSIH